MTQRTPYPDRHGQRLRLQKLQARGVALRHDRLTQAHSRDLRQLFEIVFLFQQRRQPPALDHDAQPPAPVPVDGGVRVDVETAKPPQQPPLHQGIGPAHAAELGGEAL